MRRLRGGGMIDTSMVAASWELSSIRMTSDWRGGLFHLSDLDVMPNNWIFPSGPQKKINKSNKNKTARMIGWGGGWEGEW